MANKTYKICNEVCPFRGFEKDGKTFKNCAGPACGWWNKHTKTCAVVGLGYSLHRIDMNLQKICKTLKIEPVELPQDE